MNLCERAHFNVVTYRGEELGFCVLFLSSKKPWEQLLVRRGMIV